MAHLHPTHPTPGHPAPAPRILPPPNVSKYTKYSEDISTPAYREQPLTTTTAEAGLDETLDDLLSSRGQERLESRFRPPNPLILKDRARNWVTHDWSLTVLLVRNQAQSCPIDGDRRAKMGSEHIERIRILRPRQPSTRPKDGQKMAGRSDTKESPLPPHRAADNGSGISRHRVVRYSKASKEVHTR